MWSWLFDFDQRGALAYHLTGLNEDAFYNTGNIGIDDIFHLHCFESDNALCFFDSVTHFDRHLQNGAGQRCLDSKACDCNGLNFGFASLLFGFALCLLLGLAGQTLLLGFVPRGCFGLGEVVFGNQWEEF